MKNIKNILLYGTLTGLFLIPFIPFIVPSSMFFPFIVGKGFVFRILAEIIFGLYVVLACLEPEYRPKLSWITKSVVIFGLVVLVADLFGMNVYKSLWSNYERMEGFVLIFHLVLYYIVISSMFRTMKSWNRFFSVSIGASLIMSIYGCLQLAGKITINQGGVRLDGTFGNASYFAIYLVFHIFLCFYSLFDFSKPKWQKWVYGLTALFECAILYFTATRGSILGLIGGLFLSAILMVLLKPRRGAPDHSENDLGKEKENQKLRKVAKWILGVVAVFILVFLAVRNTSFVQSSPVLSRFSHLGISEFQTQGRYFVWPMAFKGALENPILGWGQENFNFVFNKYYDPRMFGQEQWFDRTHNVILDWLISGGLLGLLAYISMYVALLYYLWRKESPLKLSEKSILTGMIAAYVFHNLFVFDNLTSYLLFFSVLGYVHVLSVSNSHISAISEPKRFSNPILMYVIFPGVLLVTALGIYFINVPAIQANLTLIQAIKQQTKGPEENLALFQKAYAYNSFGSTEITEQLLSLVSSLPGSAASNDIKQKFYDLAKSKIEEKVKETPHDARYLSFAGILFNRFGQYDQAIPYLEKALAESPNKQNMYYELAASYVGKHDYAKVFELDKAAYDLAPTFLESRIIYALGALYTRNTKVLQEMAPFIDNATIMSDNRFLKAYADIGDYTTVINILSARIQNNPNDTQSKLSLASVYVTIGQKQKAIDIIRAMIQADSNFQAQGEEYIRQIQSQ